MSFNLKVFLTIPLWLPGLALTTAGLVLLTAAYAILEQSPERKVDER